MPRPRPTFFAAVAALLAPAALASAAHAAPLRSDSTVVDGWRLPNGLEVRTLSVPHASGVSVTLAFRAGSGYEPAEQEGLSELLAELQFTCAAGDVPARTREEMASLRPLGWELRPGTRLVRFTEIATQAQLPGVLQQIAKRLAGVQVTDADLKAALAQVRRAAGSRLFGEPGDVLYWRGQLLARGANDERIVKNASLKGLEKLTLKDVQPALKRFYQPGNASLALAGDLSGIDARAIVQSLFAGIPGGAALPDTVELRLKGGRHVTVFNGITAPVGTIAVESPALSDTLQPAFYLGMVITGPMVSSFWGAPKPPLTTRFQYSIMDEPELVRFYPPVRTDATDPDLLAGALNEQLQVAGGRLVSADLVRNVRHSVGWLLGGELPSEVRERVRRDPGGLGTLSSGLATRALWRGDAFWADYLRRFNTLRFGHSYYYEWMTDAKHETTLLLTPPH